MPELSQVAVGDELPELRVRITRSGIVRYSGASTDFNEIHFSDRHAQAIGLPGVVAHGMWTMGAGLRVVTDWLGDPALVTSYFVRFTRRVLVPDNDEGAEVVYRATVAAVTETGARITLTATCGDDTVLGAARAEVRLG